MKRRTFVYTGVAIAVGVGLSDLFLLEQRTKVEETTIPLSIHPVKYLG